MLISIIIPVYNAQSTLECCLESLRLQSYQNLDIWLVNDGSTDDSEVICMKYVADDQRFHYICKKNGGVSSARNLGIKHAKGAWLMFVDSDDFVDRDYVASYVRNIDTENCVIVGGYKKIEKEELRQSYCFPSKLVCSSTPFDCKLFDDILIFGTPWAKMFPKDVINEHYLEFNEKFQIHEDHIFFFQVLQVCPKIKTIDNIGYNYVSLSNDTLSRRKIFPYKSKLDAYFILKESLITIQGVYPVMESDLPKIKSFICHLYLDAVIMAAKSSIKGDDLKNLLSLQNKKELRINYIPHSFRGYVLKAFFLLLPTKIQYILLSLK